MHVKESIGTRVKVLKSIAYMHIHLFSRFVNKRRNLL